MLIAIGLVLGLLALNARKTGLPEAVQPQVTNGEANTDPATDLPVPSVKADGNHDDDKAAADNSDANPSTAPLQFVPLDPTYFEPATVAIDYSKASSVPLTEAQEKNNALIKQEQEARTAASAGDPDYPGWTQAEIDAYKAYLAEHSNDYFGV